MKRLPLALLPLVVAAVFVVAWSCAHSQSSAPQSSQALPPVQVYFSPKGGCTEACVKEIDNARKMILVQAYSFTSAPIAKALVEAHNRGVDVRVILDKSQRGEKYSSADFVRHAGIQTFIDAKHAIAHNKVMVIDGETVITGSFNFTKAAEENNAENMLVIRDPALAEKYRSNWDKHVEHSDEYKPPEKGYSETHRTGTPDPAPKAADSVTTGFVASKNSQVFHKAGCKGAAKISEKNLVKYATREEAIQAGKKPCHECQP
jgi:phosphatidylserine/phosphatidylglycerophosphate/cardiolipin synthase-like enzyme